ncbi:IS3 family transposase [Yoonia sp. MH D7]
MVTPVAKRNAVVHLCRMHGVSQRRACDMLQMDRSTVRYLSRRGDDLELPGAIKLVSRERHRFGCRRVHVMIARDGFEVNHKKVKRIYCEEELQVRRRRGRKPTLSCGFNGSLQHRLQISLLVSGIARFFLAARLADVRLR